MTQADDDRDLVALEAVTALAGGDDVRGKVQRLADAVSRDRIQKCAVLARDLVEPSVLGMARRLPVAAGRSVGERRRCAGAQRRTGRDQSAAEPRKKRPPREGRPDVGALHVHLTWTGRTAAVGTKAIIGAIRGRGQRTTAHV